MGHTCFRIKRTSAILLDAGKCNLSQLSGCCCHYKTITVKQIIFLINGISFAVANMWGGGSVRDSTPGYQIEVDDTL